MSPPSSMNLGKIEIQNNAFEFGERIERILRLNSGEPPRQLQQLRIALTIVTHNDGWVIMSLERTWIEKPEDLRNQVKKWYGLSPKAANDLTEILILPSLKALCNAEQR